MELFEQTGNRTDDLSVMNHISNIELPSKKIKMVISSHQSDHP